MIIMRKWIWPVIISDVLATIFQLKTIDEKESIFNSDVLAFQNCFGNIYMNCLPFRRFFNNQPIKFLFDTTPALLECIEWISRVTVKILLYRCNNITILSLYLPLSLSFRTPCPHIILISGWWGSNPDQGIWCH